MSILHVLITLFFLGVFGSLILRSPFFKDPVVPRGAFLGAFLLKFLAGMLLWAVYSFHYPMQGNSDAFNYFEEAMTLHQILYEDPLAYGDILLGTEFDEGEAKLYLEQADHWEKPYNYGIVNDNRTIIRANMICRWFSFGYYHVHTAIFCFVSFLGMTALYRSFRRHLPNMHYGGFLAAFLIPSVVFWGSGVLKEAILLFGMGFFFYYWVRSIEDRDRSTLPWALLFTLFLVSIKTYVLLALVPGLLCYWMAHALKHRYTLADFLFGHAILGSFAFHLPYFGIPYDVLGMIRLKQKDFYNVAELHDAGSSIEAPPIEGWESFFLGVPEALWNALFRPHILEMEKWLYLPPAMENLCLLLALIFASCFWKAPAPASRPIYLWGLSFVLILGILIGFTTPVLGAIIRYQIPLLPFFIFVLLLPFDRSKGERFLARFRRGKNG